MEKIRHRRESGGERKSGDKKDAQRNDWWKERCGSGGKY